MIIHLIYVQYLHLQLLEHLWCVIGAPLLVRQIREMATRNGSTVVAFLQALEAFLGLNSYIEFVQTTFHVVEKKKNVCVLCVFSCVHFVLRKILYLNCDM